MTARPGRDRRGAESTARRILRLLRRGAMTVDELAAALDLTGNAVRAHLTALERDEAVEQSGTRRGVTKPAVVYSTTATSERLESRLYIPLLTQVVRLLAERMRPDELRRFMRDAGRLLAEGIARPRGKLRRRVQAASALLNELGAATEVTRRDGRFVIRGHGCPLAEVTQPYAAGCEAVEAFLAEVIGSDVVVCCDREERPRCCFEIPISRR
jgi:predicted ArsR family transcriptional regulator